MSRRVTRRDFGKGVIAATTMATTTVLTMQRHVSADGKESQCHVPFPVTIWLDWFKTPPPDDMPDWKKEFKCNQQGKALCEVAA